MQSLNRNGNDPAVAHGTIVPSMGPCSGGPPHATYSWGESDAVIPHRSEFYCGKRPASERQKSRCAMVAAIEF